MQAAGRKHIMDKNIMITKCSATSGHCLCLVPEYPLSMPRQSPAPQCTACQCNLLPNTRRVLPCIVCGTPLPGILLENWHRIQTRQTKRRERTWHKINASGRHQDSYAHEPIRIKISLQIL